MKRSIVVDTGDPALPLRVVETDRLRLAFLPAVGGRLLSLRIDGREMLWQNPAFFDHRLQVVTPRSRWAPLDASMASWSNVGGSKSWPAPQGWGGEGEWAGPPDPVLDSGEWSWHEADRADALDVVLESPDDPRTGVRMIRRFHIPARGLRFRQEVEVLATGGRVVRWAPWEVCQVDVSSGVGAASAMVRVGTAGGVPIDLGQWWNEVRFTVEHDTVEIPVQNSVGKLGFGDATGRLEWLAPDGHGLVLEFEPDPEGEYPDRGARAELWMQAPTPQPLVALGGLHPDAQLLELEVLGPLMTLRAGERASLVIDWEVR